MTRAHVRPDWIEEIEHALSGSLGEFQRVTGGDIAASYRVEFEGSAAVFVKDYGDGPTGIGHAEARGLAWLGEATELRIPGVLASGPTWLALEWIDPGTPHSRFAEELGSGLAGLHSARCPRFGWESDNWIGPIPQRNDERENWPDFYAECRLRPLIDRATRAGAFTTKLAELTEEVIRALPDLTAEAEPPARLHGDLWSGNVLADETGSPCLIDPAPYAGHREVDLAMMRLFGGFEERVFETYHERNPLAPGSEERVALYQIYPLLVHVCLFGQSYVEQLRSALSTALGNRSYQSTRGLT